MGTSYTSIFDIFKEKKIMRNITSDYMLIKRYSNIIDSNVSNNDSSLPGVLDNSKIDSFDCINNSEKEQ